MLQVTLESNAKAPVKGSEYSAGYDLFSIQKVTVPANSRILIRTGVKMAIPNGYVGIIKSRSSLASKGIDAQAGVIDSDFRGEVKVLLSNSNSEDFEILIHDRIAQLLIIPVLNCFEVVVCDTLDSTQRGEGGFGSTGK